jgi:hypothetical protein
MLWRFCMPHFKVNVHSGGLLDIPGPSQPSNHERARCTAAVSSGALPFAIALCAVLALGKGIADEELDPTPVVRM